MSEDSKPASYSDAETERRANATLKRMLATPPKPHKDSKLGKRSAKAPPKSVPVVGLVADNFTDNSALWERITGQYRALAGGHG